MTDDPLIPWLRSELARLLDVPTDRIAADTQILELGLDSLAAVRLCGTISEKVGFDVDPMLVFDFPTIDEMVTHLRGLASATEPNA
ncbi:MAG TPA: acyl carrier protein [Ramlibacter sp.]|uniref:acyl carrier protein n=1 Tax=Ramlibacter sp. TaxID=1917967 RepID=UPI002D12BBBE|nr:acyl carrier protein [Ramlibacter sp.]HVZ44385.1 acyl carrier protein [Ramlibacter sp.]